MHRSSAESTKDLGRELNMMNDLTPLLGRRRRAAWGAYKSIKDVVKKTRNTRLRAHLFNTTVLPALTYASETWAFRKQEENAVSVIERAIERAMLGVSRFTQVRDGIRSSLLRQRSKIRDAAAFAKESKIRWAVHVMCFNDNRWTRAVSYWVPRDIKRTIGRPPTRWSDFFTKSFKEKGDALRVPRERRNHCATLARDRDKWKYYWRPLDQFEDQRDSINQGNFPSEGSIFHDVVQSEGGSLDTHDDLQLGAAANNLGGVGDAQESFTLEPLEAGALDRQQERRRRRRRLIIDDQKNISGDEMKANMADYSDTLQSLDLAPPTRRLMRMKESGTVEKLFHLPGCVFMKAKPLVRLYQSHLVMRARVEEDILKADEIRREMDMSETIDDDIPYNIESVYGDDYEDIGPVQFEPLGAESPTPMVADLQIPLEESQVKYAEEYYPLSEKRRRKSEVRIAEEEDAVEGDEDHRWSKRTQNVLNIIGVKLRLTDETQIVLSDLLTKGSTRKTAAQKFYTLLVLKKSQAISVEQREPYGEIFISAGPNIAQTLAK
ncbi:hypothetical protein RB195_022851 [Necator americanus]|uniref:Rad21/Rec8-like protein C-terminal eukaryotic domain-containing protein n=1 Tax=Necator americanus TaxID=51031 RepID=A0ABR1EGU7_NECAM